MDTALTKILTVYKLNKIRWTIKTNIQQFVVCMMVEDWLISLPQLTLSSMIIDQVWLFTEACATVVFLTFNLTHAETTEQSKLEFCVDVHSSRPGIIEYGTISPEKRMQSCRWQLVINKGMLPSVGCECGGALRARAQGGAAGRAGGAVARRQRGARRRLLLRDLLLLLAELRDRPAG